MLRSDASFIQNLTLFDTIPRAWAARFRPWLLVTHLLGPNAFIFDMHAHQHCKVWRVHASGAKVCAVYLHPLPSGVVGYSIGAVWFLGGGGLSFGQR